MWSEEVIGPGCSLTLWKVWLFIRAMFRNVLILCVIVVGNCGPMCLHPSSFNSVFMLRLTGLLLLCPSIGCLPLDFILCRWGRVVWVRLYNLCTARRENWVVCSQSLLNMFLEFHLVLFAGRVNPSLSVPSLSFVTFALNVHWFGVASLVVWEVSFWLSNVVVINKWVVIARVESVYIVFFRSLRVKVKVKYFLESRSGNFASMSKLSLSDWERVFQSRCRS